MTANENELPVYQCARCGKQWDDDGCRVSVVSGLTYEAEEFVCADCKREEKESNDE